MGAGCLGLGRLHGDATYIRLQSRRLWGRHGLHVCTPLGAGSGVALEHVHTHKGVVITGEKTHAHTVESVCAVVV